MAEVDLATERLDAVTGQIRALQNTVGQTDGSA